MTGPRRIRLSRAAGWRMPENTVKVDRSTMWGNPFKVSQCREAGFCGTDLQLAKRCAEAFRTWLGQHWEFNWQGPESEAARAAILNKIEDLRGKSLACWRALCERHRDGKPFHEPCADCAPCHADVLGQIANGFKCEAVS